MHSENLPVQSFQDLLKGMATLTRLPQFDQQRQYFRGFRGKSFHYIFFWIIFEGSLRPSFSSRICW